MYKHIATVSGIGFAVAGSEDREAASSLCCELFTERKRFIRDESRRCGLARVHREM